MIWVVIVLIFLVAFGPLLWLMPSPRERRLAALRQSAYREGLRVEMRRLPRANPAAEERVTAGGRALDLNRECAAYLKPLGRRLRMLPAWRLLRHGDGVKAFPGWAFEPGQKPDHPRLDAAMAALATVVGELPDDVIALECEPQNIAAYWVEGPGSTPDQVTDLARQLAVAADALGALDRRLEEETEGRKI